jgi:uncharacterized Zn finger protein
VERLKFLIKGSRGDEYAVVFEISGSNANAFCTCAAGAKGQYCKHRFAIMGSDVSRLLSSNTADIVRLKSLMQGTDLAAAYERVLKAATVFEAAKKEFDTAKKALAKAMYR